MKNRLVLAIFLLTISARAEARGKRDCVKKDDAAELAHACESNIHLTELRIECLKAAR